MCGRNLCREAFQPQQSWEAGGQSVSVRMRHSLWGGGGWGLTSAPLCQRALRPGLARRGVGGPRDAVGSGLPSYLHLRRGEGSVRQQPSPPLNNESLFSRWTFCFEQLQQSPGCPARHRRTPPDSQTDARASSPTNQVQTHCPVGPGALPHRPGGHS